MKRRSFLGLALALPFLRLPEPKKPVPTLNWKSYIVEGATLLNLDAASQLILDDDADTYISVKADDELVLFLSTDPVGTTRTVSGVIHTKQPYLLS